MLVLAFIKGVLDRQYRLETRLNQTHGALLSKAGVDGLEVHLVLTQTGSVFTASGTSLLHQLYFPLQFVA